ncbi:putative serine/threonine-protein kinase, active [Septoria linicola]|nr:putative serine/threonine-protein kinase, active [Septoria linicola]
MTVSTPHNESQSTWGSWLTGSVSAAYSKVTSSITCPNIVGPTPSCHIEQLRQALSGDFKYNDTYEANHVKDFPESTEGPVYVTRSATTRSCFVVKHTRPARATEREIPNDAYIAGTVLAPHPNVIRVHACLMDSQKIGRHIVHSDRHFVYMDWCRGGDLWLQMEYLWNKHRADAQPLFVLHVFVQLFEAFAFIHHGLRYIGAGKYTRDENHKAVIHGDVKPENIFLHWSSRNIGGMPDLQLADFGHSRLVGQTDFTTNPGTAVYWSPEDHAIGKRSFNAFGMRRDLIYNEVLYFVAANVGCGDGSTWPIGEDPSTLTISRQYTTDNLANLVRRCLQVHPRGRASASFDADGVLELVHGVRQVRDGMIRQGERMEPYEWRSPPP